MNKKIGALFLAGIMLVSVAGCTKQNGETANIAAPETVAEETQKISPTESYTVEIVTEDKAVTRMGEETTMAITYPLTSDIDNEELLTRVNGTLEESFTFIQLLLAGEANVIDHDMRVSYDSEHFLSVVYRYTTDPSGNGKITYDMAEGVTVDMHSGAPVDMRQLLEGGSPLATLLSEKLALELEAQQIELEDPFAKGIVTTAWLTDGGITINFWDEKSYEFTLPLSAEEMDLYLSTALK